RPPPHHPRRHCRRTARAPAPRLARAGHPPAHSAICTCRDLTAVRPPGRGHGPPRTQRHRRPPLHEGGAHPMSEPLTRPPAQHLRLLLTAREAAAALAVSQRTLEELRRRGELTPIRLPGRGKARALRYHVQDLENWIQRVKQE